MMELQQLLLFAMNHQASDIHLSSDLPPMIRVDGDIRRIQLPALSSTQIEYILKQICSETQYQTFQTQLELDFSFEIAGLSRIRVNAFHQHRGIALALRLIPHEIKTLQQLGLDHRFESIANLKHGLVLVTGATGSGKSTTLASLIDHINQTRQQHILTLEDPIEFVHAPKKCLIHQREIQRDSHTFPKALRSALREDPDIILIGEMRDLETIKLALTAAETGHLVFATLHTSSAIKTIDRIIDSFPSDEQALIRTMLAESLQAVIAQTLVKKTTSGRIAVHEILRHTPAIAHLIRENKLAQIYSILQTQPELGMNTLDQRLQQLLTQGIIHLETAQSIARYPEQLV